MSGPSQEQVTMLRAKCREGDDGTTDELFAAVYEELRLRPTGSASAGGEDPSL